MNKYLAHQNQAHVWTLGGYVSPASVTVTRVRGFNEQPLQVEIPGVHKFVGVWTEDGVLHGEGFNTNLAARIFQEHVQGRSFMALAYNIVEIVEVP